MTTRMMMRMIVPMPMYTVRSLWWEVAPSQYP